ncbi:MAG: DUF4173 domain-containing protein [Gemmatimonadales bacterium]|nr:DUF4173 domain-containing protein [Gemmatimonadales bacterium]
MNPDAVIARTNLGRAGAGRAVDLSYAAQLSADAIPAIQRLLPALEAGERCALVHALKERWEGEIERGGRWTISFASASRRMRSRPWVVAGSC